MFKDLLKYEELFEACENCFGFGKVTMLRNFGPLSEGRMIGSLWFLLDTSVCEVFDDEGTTLLTSFPFTLQA